MQFAIPDKSFDCMLPMLRAKSVEQLYEGTRGFALMDHNVVAGDTSGKIGHRVRALVPARPRSNGWLPVPGWTGSMNGTAWCHSRRCRTRLRPTAA